MELAGRIPLVRRRRKKPWSPRTKAYLALAIYDLCLGVWNGYYALRGSFINMPALGLCIVGYFYFFNEFKKSRRNDERE